MPTPAQEAEVDSLMSARSPVPSLDIRRPGNFTSDSAIPGLNINPPNDTSETKTSDNKDSNNQGEGLGGWISKIAQRARGGDGKSSGSGGDGAYARLQSQDD